MWPHRHRCRVETSRGIGQALDESVVHPTHQIAVVLGQEMPWARARRPCATPAMGAPTMGKRMPARLGMEHRRSPHRVDLIPPERARGPSSSQSVRSGGNRPDARP